MCLGAQAKAANETARRNYKYQLQRRERDWQQQLSLTRVERIQYEKGLNASNLQLAGIYADIQEKQGELIGESMQADEENWKKFLQENTGANMAASGQTGVSARRTATLDLAQYLTESSRRGRAVTKASRELKRQGAKAAGAAAAQQEQMFAQQAFVKTPDLAPPQPVMQNEGAAAFMDLLKIGGSIANIAGMPIGDSTLGGKIFK